MKEPSEPFNFENETKEKYENKTYRLPTNLLEGIEKMRIKDDTSACKIVAQMIKWALKAQEEE